jgi:hypothetical protein
MRSGGKACWRTIQLEDAGGGEREGISRHERLAALYRFQNGEALTDLRLVDPLARVEVTDPAQIDWAQFPELSALEAVTRDELHRLRTLLRADAGVEPRRALPSSDA